MCDIQVSSNLAWMSVNVLHQNCHRDQHIDMCYALICQSEVGTAPECAGLSQLMAPRKMMNGVQITKLLSSDTESGTDSGDDVVDTDDLSISQSQLNIHPDYSVSLEQAVREATTLQSSQVLDGIIGQIGNGVDAIISFDNYATVGIVDESIDVSHMTQVAEWDGSYIGGYGGQGETSAGPLY